MSRHVDLGHYSDAAFLGVGNHLADFVVGVELALVATFPLVLGIIELRIGLALDAPSGMVGEVPMEVVQLVEAHQIQGFLQQAERLIVAPRVVHEATERIGCPVVDFAVGHHAISANQLVQSALRPNGIACDGGFAPLDHDAVFVGVVEDGFGIDFDFLQLVFLLAELLIRFRFRDDAYLGFFVL